MPLIVAGSLNLDLVGRAPRIPAPGETVLGSSLQRFHGGKGGNQAVAAARAGATVRFAGAVGDDAAGHELLAGLQAEGIDITAVLRTDEPTGAALITVSPGGENAITVLPGANMLAPQPSPAWPEGVGWLLLQLEIPLATCLAWARAAHAGGARVMLNAAPAPRDDRTDHTVDDSAQDAVQALLSQVDLLLVNQGEARALARAESDLPLHAVLERLAARGPAIVVATLGARGCIALNRQAPGWIEQPSMAIDVVDTTGAGDTFAGALAAALDEDTPLDQALAFASVAAALSCTAPGARGGMPSRAVIEAGRDRVVRSGGFSALPGEPATT
jgi:ribokinase